MTDIVQGREIILCTVLAYKSYRKMTKRVTSADRVVTMPITLHIATGNPDSPSNLRWNGHDCGNDHMSHRCLAVVFWFFAWQQRPTLLRARQC